MSTRRAIKARMLRALAQDAESDGVRYLLEELEYVAAPDRDTERQKIEAVGLELAEDLRRRADRLDPPS